MTQEKKSKENKYNKLICVGKLVKFLNKSKFQVKSYTEEPSSIKTYKNLYLSGKYSIKLSDQLKGKKASYFIAEFNSINDIDPSTLEDDYIYTRRSDFAVPEDDEYFIYDLIGLSVKDNNDLDIGTINMVYNFGAGDIIEIKKEDGELIMIPFTQENFPEVSLNEAKIIISNKLLIN
jgi:16S rRNA processing protein RimM